MKLVRSPEEAGESGRLAAWQVPLLTRIANETGTTSLIVTHDPRIMNLADRIVHMERGRIEANVVVAERLFVSEGLRQSPPFAALLPEEQQKIADELLVGVHPDLPLRAGQIAANPGRVEVLRTGDRDHSHRRAGGRVEQVLSHPARNGRSVACDRRKASQSGRSPNSGLGDTSAKLRF